MVAALPTPNTSESERPDDLRVKLLLKAIQRGDAAEVEVVLSGDVDVNATTSRGTTPLMSAVTYGHFEIVRVLLKRGAEPNQKRSDGFTALALAAFFGQEAIVRALLVCGADMRAVSRANTSRLAPTLPKRSQLRSQPSQTLWRSPHLSAELKKNLTRSL